MTDIGTDLQETADRIKQRLRECVSAEEIAIVANEERATVKAMSETEDGRALAIQIANLKAWQLQEMDRVIE